MIVEKIPALATMDAIGESIRIGLIQCPRASLELLCAVIEDMRVDHPLPMLTEIDASAQWWAGNATTVELEAYLYAIGARLSETQMHHRTRKRIVANMFRAMNASDKAAFIAWAQSEGSTE